MLSKLRFFFVLCVFYAVNPQLQIDYCTLECADGVHTVCSRKNDCLPVGGCQMVPPTQEFREKIVRMHNTFRNSIAGGLIGEYFGNTGATDMEVMSYDMELEYFAECWANLCPGLNGDTCRDSSRFPVGQNAYTTFYSSSVDVETEAFANWSKTMELVKHPALIASYREHPASSFTQLAWSRTRFVGCALALYGANYSNALFFCNYGPAGNIDGEPVYRMSNKANPVGGACAGQKNPIYSNLCGNIEATPTGMSWTIEVAQMGPVYPLKKFGIAATVRLNANLLLVCACFSVILKEMGVVNI